MAKDQKMNRSCVVIYIESLFLYYLTPYFLSSIINQHQMKRFFQETVLKAITRDGTIPLSILIKQSRYDILMSNVANQAN